MSYRITSCTEGDPARFHNRSWPFFCRQVLRFFFENRFVGRLNSPVRCGRSARSDLEFQLFILADQGFVHQDQPGAGEDGSSQGDPLALTAGKLIDAPVEQVAGVKPASVSTVPPPLPPT